MAIIYRCNACYSLVVDERCARQIRLISSDVRCVCMCAFDRGHVYPLIHRKLRDFKLLLRNGFWTMDFGAEYAADFEQLNGVK